MTLRPSLAVIAHDGKKTDLVAYATYNRAVLAQFDLFATATTGRLLHEKVGLKVTTMLSGPLGGDAQIAAMVAEGRIRAVLFFVDPLSAHPHDPDIRTLLRVCNVHNIPIATTLAAANASKQASSYSSAASVGAHQTRARPMFVIAFSHCPAACGRASPSGVR